MNTGLSLRRNLLINKADGRSVIIAIDHGAIAGPVEGIEKPAPLIRACVKAGVDGILTTKGFVDASRDVWDRHTALVLRVSGGFTVLGGGFEEEIIAEPQTTVAYGASWAAITVKFGHGREGAFIRQASLEIDAYHRLGIPVMIEAMAKGSIEGKPFAPNDPGAITMVARMAAEIGADMVKTYYTGTPETFARVTAGCPVPVVILGGQKPIRRPRCFRTSGIPWKPEEGESPWDGISGATKTSPVSFMRSADWSMKIGPWKRLWK